MSSPSKRQRFKENDNNSKSYSETGVPKIVNDPIHGHLELSPACLAVIDTKQFQRLRFIKQTGFCYFVYPGASHNRFEHSLGVCHLAGQLCRYLRNNQPELGIDNKDVLCVELAGLCHDLGHGPFSHTFDGKFIPMIHPETTWKHEKASIDMLDHLIKENNLMEHKAFVDANIDECDIQFVKEMIYGPGDENKKKEWPYVGRPKNKSFLYEIVSNKRTGIDVDKWDYFARDCHHLGIRNNFDHNRYVRFIRVLEVSGKLVMCARDKEIGNLYQMFYTRYILHRSAYQHKVNCAVEIMMVDAMVKANEHLKFPGKNGELKKLSDCIFDIEAYSQLSDHILWEIACSQKPEMQEAKKIVDRIMSRDLYCCLDERLMSDKLLEQLRAKEVSLEKLRDDVIKFSESDTAHNTLDTSDFRLQIVYLDFGMKETNPLENMMYYSKSDLNHAKAINEKGLLKPPRFKDSLIRIYSCHRSLEINEFIKSCFEKFCYQYEMGDSSNPWDYEVYSTPVKRPASVSNTTPCTAGKARGQMSLP